VIRFRFGAFRNKFGRDPQSDEPLFFDPALEWPEKAEVEMARTQIQTAAAAMGVAAKPILRLLNLEPAPCRDQHRRRQTDDKSRRLSPAWERFVNNKRLHRAHNVTAAELGMLSQAAMMGEARASGDFLFILEAIRKATYQ
jgi:hypothetical protein